MKRVLMIAYHLPPHHGSSGIQRTLRFIQNLPDFGWEPIVLTVAERAYEGRLEASKRDLPRDLVLIRSQAWNAAKHFSVFGRYPGLLARPDRWVSWWPAGCWDGLRAIRRYRPQVIWSTYPIVTAHMIARTLARRTSLPWVADFRDPMAQENYPTDPTLRREFWRLEQAFATQATRLTVTTRGAASTYRGRYPELENCVRLIENGYDESSFPDDFDQTPLRVDRLTLLHSGVVYPHERDPTQLFAALGELNRREPGMASRVCVRFRAPGHHDVLESLSRQFGVQHLVEILPPTPYREALAEMRRADGLLIMQAANCNEQIPAKLYEYLRAGRPILALTDPRGDTASLVRAAGITAIAPLDDPQGIEQLLRDFVAAPGSLALASPEFVQRQSRRERTRELAALLDEVAEHRA